MSMPDEDTVPEGFRVVGDDEIVKEGDKVLDYLVAEDFATITVDSVYCVLIGLTGYKARDHILCFEVFTEATAGTEGELP